MSDTPAPPASRPAPPGPESLSGALRGVGPAGLKLVALGMLVLGLLIPQYFVAGLIAEREARQAEAQGEIGLAWGQPQTVLGPLLVVPYRSPGRDRPDTLEDRAIAIPPAMLTMAATLVPERRRRGLFEAVVYTARIDFAGRLGEIAAALPADAVIDWRAAHLMTGATDLRPATMEPTLLWGGRPLTAQGLGHGRCAGLEVLRWPLGLEGPPEPGGGFAGSMELRGTDRLALVPAARRASFTIEGAWETPSYAGSSLPVRAATEAGGFRAEWAGGMVTQAIRLAAGGCAASIGLPAPMGVALLEAVPTYRMVNRTAKYATLFVLLAVMTYWLFETMARIRIHLVQYAMLGLSMALFPLLLLAIAEPAGFAIAYAASAAMVMGQACLYTAAVTRRAGLAAIFAAVLAALFGFLYVVLQSESMALLSGALGLFAVLSAMMAATRRMG